VGLGWAAIPVIRHPFVVVIPANARKAPLRPSGVKAWDIVDRCSGTWWTG
jgi:hypothetical protein